MKNILFILILIFVFGACKRDTNTEPKPGTPVVYQDLTAYSYFKKGTYWIYKDSATSVLDSVYVPYDTSYSYYQNNGIQKTGNYMFYDCPAYSYLDNHYTYYRISMGNYSISDGSAVVERNGYHGRLLNT